MGDAADMDRLQPLMAKASGLTAQAIVASLDRPKPRARLRRVLLERK